MSVFVSGVSFIIRLEHHEVNLVMGHKFYEVKFSEKVISDGVDKDCSYRSCGVISQK